MLHGPGGTGKTELAKAFGRWWRDTAGAELVVFHSFEPGVASFGLDGVLAAIGLQAFGADFARVEPAEREAIVLRALREHRLLLIWDNFESVVSMPDPAGATPPLDETERERLRRFVAAIAAGGRSALLVTSRTTEPWLGDEIARRPVGGLTRAEASEYADALLAGSGSVQARRSRPAFGELLDRARRPPAEHAARPAARRDDRPRGAARRAAGPRRPAERRRDGPARVARALRRLLLRAPRSRGAAPAARGVAVSRRRRCRRPRR